MLRKFLLLVLLLVLGLTSLEAKHAIRKVRKAKKSQISQGAIDSLSPEMKQFYMNAILNSDSTSYDSIYYVALDTLPLHTIDFKQNIFFQNHLLREEIVQKRPEFPSNYLFYFIILLTGVVVLVKTFFTKYLNDLFRSFLNFQTAQQVMRQQDLRFSFPAILLMGNFYLALGLFFFLNGSYNHYFLLKQYWLYPVFSLCIAAFFSVKVFLYQFSIALFAPKSEVRSIVQMDFLLAEVAGIVLIPLLLIVGFADANVRSYMWLGAWILLGLILLYRYILSWRMAGSFLFSNVLHFIVYICCVEIAPVLIILKIIQGFV